MNTKQIDTSTHMLLPKPQTEHPSMSTVCPRAIIIKKKNQTQIFTQVWAIFQITQRSPSLHTFFKLENDPKNLSLIFN